jgi:hypothetical protein
VQSIRTLIYGPSPVRKVACSDLVCDCGHVSGLLMERRVALRAMMEIRAPSPDQANGLSGPRSMPVRIPNQANGLSGPRSIPVRIPTSSLSPAPTPSELLRSRTPWTELTPMPRQVPTCCSCLTCGCGTPRRRWTPCPSRCSTWSLTPPKKSWNEPGSRCHGLSSAVVVHRLQSGARYGQGIEATGTIANFAQRTPSWEEFNEFIGAKEATELAKKYRIVSYSTHCKTFIADFDYRTALAREMVVLSDWRGD